MNYKDFDNVQTSSPIELHKTDYNNYADLSHFIEQYNIAQQIIKECGKFYKSFLESKLMTWERLLKCTWRDKIDFTKVYNNMVYYDSWYQYDKPYISNLVIDIFTRYINEQDHYDWSYNKSKKSSKLKLVNIITTKKEIKQLQKDIVDNEYALALIIKDKFSEETLDALGSFYSIKCTDSVIKGKCYSWITVIENIYEHYYSKEYTCRYLNEITLSQDIIDWSINEYKSLYKQYSKKQLLENCIVYTKNYTKRELAEKLIQKLNSLNIPKECCSIPTSVDNMNRHIFFHQMYNEPKKIQDTKGSCHYEVTPHDIISKEEFNTLMKDIESFIFSIVDEYHIEDIFTNIPTYYVVYKNALMKFSDDLKNVNIELSKDQKTLICIDEAFSEHLKYTWPSDAPIIRTTVVSKLVFDTATNEIQSFDVKQYQDEIKTKHRY